MPISIPMPSVSIEPIATPPSTQDVSISGAGVTAPQPPLPIIVQPSEATSIPAPDTSAPETPTIDLTAPPMPTITVPAPEPGTLYLDNTSSALALPVVTAPAVDVSGVKIAIPQKSLDTMPGQITGLAGMDFKNLGTIGSVVAVLVVIGFLFGKRKIYA